MIKNKINRGWGGCVSINISLASRAQVPDTSSRVDQSFRPIHPGNMSNKKVSTQPHLDQHWKDDPLVFERPSVTNNVDITLWEHKNPRSLINLVSPKLAEHMRALQPYLFTLSDSAFAKKYEAPWIVQQLKICFWDEYFLTQDKDFKSMRIEAMYSKVCSKEYFYELVSDPLTLTYILRPPSGYMIRMRSLLDIGLERFREILTLPIVDYNGKIDAKHVNNIIKIVSIVDNRVKGAVTQNIKIDGTHKSMNMNVNYEAPKSHRQIESELLQIEKEILELQTPPARLGGASGEEDEGREYRDEESGSGDYQRSEYEETGEEEITLGEGGRYGAYEVSATGTQAQRISETKED